MFDIKYKIVFLRHEFQTWSIVKVLKFKQIKKEIKFNEKTYIINPECPSYCRKLEKLYMVDIEKGSQIVFNTTIPPLNPSEMDLLISNKLLKELISGITDTTKDKILLLIIGAIVGGLIGAMIVMGIYQKKIDEIYASSNIINFSALQSIGGML